MAKSYTRPLQCRRYYPAFRLSTAGAARQMQMRSGAVANFVEAAGEGRKAETVVHRIDDCLCRASRLPRRHCRISRLSSIILRHSRHRLFDMEFCAGKGGNNRRKAPHIGGQVGRRPASGGRSEWQRRCGPRLELSAKPRYADRAARSGPLGR